MSIWKSIWLVFTVVFASCGNLTAGLNIVGPTAVPTRTAQCEADIQRLKQKLTPIMADLYGNRETDPAKLMNFYAYQFRILDEIGVSSSQDSFWVGCSDVELENIALLMEQSIYHSYEGARAMLQVITSKEKTDSSSVQKYQKEGERLFAEASTKFLAYLVRTRDPYAVKQIFGITAEELQFSMRASLTSTAEAISYQSQFGSTTNETPVAGSAQNSASCNDELMTFVRSVSKMVAVSHSFVTDMSQYADNGLASSFDKAFVERTYAGLEGIVIPTCADQPTEIKYSLGVIRDTLLPAYIEMAMGGATSASRSDVGRWRDEVNGLLNDVDRLMSQIE